MSVSGVIQILRTNSVTNRIQDFSEWSAAQYEKLGGGGGGGGPILKVGVGGEGAVRFRPA